MVAKNDITGDSIQSKVTSQKYRDNYDDIFRKVDHKEGDEVDQLNRIKETDIDIRIQR